MKLHVKKGLLVLRNGKQTVLFATPSKSVRGAIDLTRLSGIVEHPSPRQAQAILAKAGVARADFQKAFGYML